MTWIKCGSARYGNVGKMWMCYARQYGWNVRCIVYIRLCWRAKQTTVRKWYYTDSSFLGCHTMSFGSSSWSFVGYGAFIYMLNQSKKTTTCRVTQCHISENLNLLKHNGENVKSCTMIPLSQLTHLFQELIFQFVWWPDNVWVCILFFFIFFLLVFRFCFLFWWPRVASVIWWRCETLQGFRSWCTQECHVNTDSSTADQWLYHSNASEETLYVDTYNLKAFDCWPVTLPQ